MPTEWQKSKTVFEAFRHAADGLRRGIAGERNVRIQLVLYIGVALLAWLLGFSRESLALVILAGGLVVSLELINTALEDLSDVVDPRYHETLRGVKDIAAGAVLVASAAAALIGLLLFIPALL